MKIGITTLMETQMVTSSPSAKNDSSLSLHVRPTFRARTARVRRRSVLTAAIALITLGSSSQTPAQTSAPLLAQSDLVYQGAFRVPQGATDTTTANYGGTSIAFNPANNSLYIVGHDWYQLTGEIRVPSIVNGSTITSLNTATLLQTYRDATEGRLGSINSTAGDIAKVGGQFIYNGNLYLTAYSFYDGAIKQSTSQFVRPLNLATTGQVKGPFKVGSDYPGFVSGYMALIPSEWQQLLGGPVLIGHCCLAIASVQSNGPAASVFNPEHVGTVTPIAASPVVGYPADHPLGPGWGTTNNLYNGTTQIRGLVFPAGTRSVLFFGRHGTGTFCYGTGAACGDPVAAEQGTHAYPYRSQVWAYDANELLAVKNGTKQRWQVQPYGIWALNLPFGSPEIGGAAYDPQTQRIYVSQLRADVNSAPIIHVFRVQVAQARETIAPPGNLRLGP